MRQISIYTLSLGCPKNLVDTEKMLGRLGKYYKPAQDLEQADLVLVNTCSFIQPAVEESIQNILDIAQKLQDLEPRPQLVVTGCFVQRYRGELEAELPEVDLWMDLSEQTRFREILFKRLGWGTNQKHEVDPDFSADENSGFARVISTPPGYSYLKISEGCPHNCNFCLIPSLRGKLRSEKISNLKKEAQGILNCGVKELCLVAQDLTSYGRDLGKSEGLQDLLRELVQLNGLSWLRLMYLYPSGIKEDLLAFLSSLGEKFKPYFDIPMQHAHPEILKQMGRPFSKNPQEVIGKIKKYFPEASIRSTFIVGFPGETERYFQTLLEFVQDTRFDHLGVFPFYPEEGTKAANMRDQIPEKEKEDRVQEILELQSEISASVLNSYVGTWQEVLIDRKDPEWPTLYQSRCWFQAPEIDGITYLSATECSPGDLILAQIQESKTYDLTALA